MYGKHNICTTEESSRCERCTGCYLLRIRCLSIQASAAFDLNFVSQLGELGNNIRDESNALLALSDLSWDADSHGERLLA